MSEKALGELVNAMYHEWSYGGGTSYVGTQNTEDPTWNLRRSCLGSAAKWAIR